MGTLVFDRITKDVWLAEFPLSEESRRLGIPAEERRLLHAALRSDNEELKDKCRSVVMAYAELSHYEQASVAPQLPRTIARKFSAS